MDLNELLSRHQIALLDMANSPTAAQRIWAEDCADYYAVCIATLRRRGHDNLGDSHDFVKGMMRARGIAARPRRYDN